MALIDALLNQETPQQTPNPVSANQQQLANNMPIPGNPIASAAAQGVSNPQQVQQSLSDTLRPLVQDEADDFLVTVAQIADDHGILDDAFGPESVEDQADLLENPDPTQFLSKEELMLLAEKFLAIPEEKRTVIEQELRNQLPPEVVQRLEAVLRFAEMNTPKEGQV